MYTEIVEIAEGYFVEQALGCEKNRIASPLMNEGLQMLFRTRPISAFLRSCWCWVYFVTISFCLFVSSLSNYQNIFSKSVIASKYWLCSRKCDFNSSSCASSSLPLNLHLLYNGCRVAVFPVSNGMQIFSFDIPIKTNGWRLSAASTPHVLSADELTSSVNIETSEDRVTWRRFTLPPWARFDQASGGVVMVMPWPLLIRSSVAPACFALGLLASIPLALLGPPSSSTLLLSAAYAVSSLSHLTAAGAAGGGGGADSVLAAAYAILALLARTERLALHGGAAAYLVVALVTLRDRAGGGPISRAEGRLGWMAMAATVLPADCPAR